MRFQIKKISEFQDFWDDFVQPKLFSGSFQSPESQLKIPINSGLGQAGIAEAIL